MPAASEYQTLEGLPLPAAILRAERVVYANPAMTALLGASTEELARLSMTQLLERFMPRERTWIEPLYEAHPRGERHPGAELWLRLRDASGQERMCHVRTTPGSQPDEQVILVQEVGSALEDVRQHREASARLTELSRLQNDLMEQERLKILGEAAGVVAHEVRNPLGSILNVAAVLKREPQLSANGASALTMLEEEVTRLEDIVRDLLDVVRPFEPRPKPLHLGELARRTVELLQPVARATQSSVELEEAPDLPLLPADETLLQLAVSNLLRYALRSSPSGGKVRLVVSRVAGGLSLVMEDQGAGLSGVDSQRVFEPFFTSRATGAGLGLAVVRRVVLAHGGTVGVRERAGGGARFEVFLPAPTP